MTASADDLSRLLFQAEQARRAFLSERLARFSLSYGQFAVLDALAREGEMTMTGLARTIVVDRTTLTRTVDGLIIAKLASRRTSPTDRRNVLVALTDAGAALASQLDDELRGAHASIFARLDTQEIESFSRALAKTAARLQVLLSGERFATDFQHSSRNRLELPKFDS